MRVKGYIARVLLATLLLSMLSACGRTPSGGENSVLVFGDTSFNKENEEVSLDPMEAYSGWACLRYGLGETLFRVEDNGQLSPWLAESYQLPNPKQWVIDLKREVHFSNGKALDATAVKKDLELLMEKLPRAKRALGIAEIKAEGYRLTIDTKEENPTLINYLAEPFSCMIDVDAARIMPQIPVGTGPMVGVDFRMDQRAELRRNENYWNGAVALEGLRVLNITDGDTLAMALQSDQIDAAYGMSYANYPIFDNANYHFSSQATSRSFFLQCNFHSSLMREDAVREALSLGIDKAGFVNILLRGRGEIAEGAFPKRFGYEKGMESSFDPQRAGEILEQAGWRDLDGDGIREKKGKKLSLRWVTYPSRQELPLLAEASQASLREIGFDVTILTSSDVATSLKEADQWDVFAGSNVNAALGDGSNFFDSYCLLGSNKNYGGYESERLEEINQRLRQTFAPEERKQLLDQMQEQILSDHAFIFCSFLQMSIISRTGISGIRASGSDFYEIDQHTRRQAAD